MEKIYTAEINVNGIIGYVGGSNADDLAQGVKACAKAIEQKVAEIAKPCCCDRIDEQDIDNDLDELIETICQMVGIDL